MVGRGTLAPVSGTSLVRNVGTTNDSERTAPHQQNKKEQAYGQVQVQITWYTKYQGVERMHQMDQTKIQRQLWQWPAGTGQPRRA